MVGQGTQTFSPPYYFLPEFIIQWAQPEARDYGNLLIWSITVRLLNQREGLRIWKVDWGSLTRYVVWQIVKK